MSATGKRVRLARLFRRGRLLMVPFDDDLINGPYEGLVNPVDRVREAVDNADAILGFQRLFDLYTHEQIASPFVLNLTASSVHRDHTRKVVVGSVEAALRSGCDGVAVHVNLSSRFESSMLAALGAAGEECAQAGMPLVAIVYPRKEHDGADDNYIALKEHDPDAYTKLIQHCVRIGVELGADVVKTQYTGDAATFSSVIATAMGIPVVVAGGRKVSSTKALLNAHGAVVAGAAGVCFGRNVYNRSNMGRFVDLLSQVVHEGRSPSELGICQEPGSDPCA